MKYLVAGWSMAEVCGNQATDTELLGCCNNLYVYKSHAWCNVKNSLHLATSDRYPTLFTSFLTLLSLTSGSPATHVLDHVISAFVIDATRDASVTVSPQDGTENCQDFDLPSSFPPLHHSFHLPRLDKIAIRAPPRPSHPDARLPSFPILSRPSTNSCQTRSAYPYVAPFHIIFTVLTLFVEPGLILRRSPYNEGPFAFSTIVYLPPALHSVL
ncbi:hypothetical protein BC826DRAFT_430079 [Russula brevipes]|nr:hypothetical protein BC826DRAFT_430079 [Russula brevipes]